MLMLVEAELLLASFVDALYELSPLAAVMVTLEPAARAYSPLLLMVAVPPLMLIFSTEGPEPTLFVTA